MIDPDAYARLLCDWCIEPRPGQQVLITTSTLAQDAALALHGALLDRGAWPLLRLSPPGLAADYHLRAQPQQLDSFPPIELAEMEAVDVAVRIDAPSNTQALAGIDPALLARSERARAPLQAARMAARWAVSIWPTAAHAQQAQMSERDYAAFVERALFLDRDDPVAAWGELSLRQADLVRRLSSARVIRIESERTDLTLDVSGRTWINSDGRRNMPSGEVFTGPHEASAEGAIRFDVPSFRRSAQVSGAELTFREGRVVEARADVGEQLLKAALATDDGARVLGELGIGTNAGIDRATGSTLLDEKIAGTVHLALGRSYPETGGVNASALHWDLICDLRAGGRLSADGDTIVEDGALAL